MLAEHEKMVIDNLGLATYIAQKYNSNYSDLDDLISVSRVGLIKATTGYDNSKNCLFSTYAGKCMTNEILMLLRRSRKHQDCVSLETPICSDGEGHEARIADTLTDEHHVDDGIMKECEQKLVRQLIESILNEKEKTVINLRYGMDGTEPITQSEVSKRLGMT